MPEAVSSVQDTLKKIIPNGVNIALGLGFTAWYLILVRVPWNGYFLARQTRRELEESKNAEPPIEVSKADEEAVKKYENRLLALALGSHVVSAGAIYLIAAYTNEQAVNKKTSLLFLASAALRPLTEMHKFVTQHLAEIGTRVKYPRADVNEIKNRVDALEYERDSLKHRVSDLENDLRNLRDITIPEVESRASQNVDAAVKQMRQETDDKLVKLDADKQMIRGVKQFFRTLTKDDESQ